MINMVIVKLVRTFNIFIKEGMKFTKVAIIVNTSKIIKNTRFKTCPVLLPSTFALMPLTRKILVKAIASTVKSINTREIIDSGLLFLLIS